MPFSALELLVESHFVVVQTGATMANWLGVIINAAILVVLVFTALYIRRQLAELVRAGRLEATKEIIEMFGSEKMRKNRHWVLEEMEEIPEDAESIPENVEKIGRQVAVAFDRLGYFARKELMPSDVLFDLQKDDIKPLWGKLENLVKHVQTKRERASYCDHFKFLAETWYPKMEEARKKSNYNG